MGWLKHRHPVNVKIFKNAKNGHTVCVFHRPATICPKCKWWKIYIFINTTSEMALIRLIIWAKSSAENTHTKKPNQTTCKSHLWLVGVGFWPELYVPEWVSWCHRTTLTIERQKLGAVEVQQSTQSRSIYAVLEQVVHWGDPGHHLAAALLLPVTGLNGMNMSQSENILHITWPCRHRYLILAFGESAQMFHLRENAIVGRNLKGSITCQCCFF